MKRTVAILTLIGLLSGAVTLARASDRPTPAALDAEEDDLCVGDNLLANPSFEGEYASYDPVPPIPDCSFIECVTAQMAPGWLPWWRSHSTADPDYIYRMPEFKPADPVFTDPSRVRSGNAAQQYFTFYSTHRAGFYQQVSVTPGNSYRFCIWGHSWSAQDDGDAYAGPEDGVLNQRVGIDPYGGTAWPADGIGANIIWGPERTQYDEYGLFSIEATAMSSIITVYTYSEPMWAVKHNDVYWDDAALVELVDTTMSVAPALGLTFLADVDDPGLQSQLLRVQFDPDQGYTWSAAIGGGSAIPLSLTPAGGGSGESLSVGVSTTGLGLGTYEATVVITASGSAVGGSPAEIPVALLVVPEVSKAYLPVSVLSP